MKCCIYTLGCKVNQYESEALAKELRTRGIEVSFGLDYAGCYILNTCAVTNEAEHKSREVIAKIRKINPSAKIYVCGCSSELHPEKYFEKENVVVVVGAEAKEKLVDYITRGTDKVQEITPVDHKNYNKNYSIDGERIRSFIKIQDGCNNFCSYCIIPYIRGRERSRELDDIVNEYKRLKKVSKEIVLVGINLSHYGFERGVKTGLCDVIKALSQFDDVRLRISSLEQDALTEELLNALKEYRNFCPSFHIPLQSGANSVLKSMNRHYDFEEYYSAIERIRKHFPNASISTDVIVGFPTETDEDFKEAIENIKRINFASMHIFPFSKRAGTVCDKFNQLDGNLVKKRVVELKEVADKSREEFINSILGHKEEVLVEEVEDGEYIGYTKTYVKCYLKTDKPILNEVVKVVVTEKYKNGVKGEIINE